MSEGVYVCRRALRLPVVFVIRHPKNSSRVTNKKRRKMRAIDSFRNDEAEKEKGEKINIVYIYNVWVEVGEGGGKEHHLQTF